MKTLSRLIAIVFLAISLPLSATDRIKSENPYDLLEKIAERMIERIGNERQQINQQPSRLRDIMEEELLPYSDYQYAARAVLARNWQRLNEAQQREFVAVFREYLVTTYARVFTQYDESRHRLEFGRQGSYEGERRVVVRARLIEEGGRPPVRLDFHMQRRSPDAPWLAFDLVAENISMLNAQQAEMQASLRQNGIEGTIALLRERAEREIRLDEEFDFDEFGG